ncbi:unnamed protein product [Echinostoma caproni]|uniref:DNA topoisomerase (ATP-hydrolyzing) n=1 Tax=Echinostoma caproni TaxID=27848 RepID=A0A183B7P8_9TREM|nr:unnamed protein product [Echinostoma caproni]
MKDFPIVHRNQRQPIVDHGRRDRDDGSMAEAFEDGHARAFLVEFEDVAELTGIRSDRGKLTALRARAVLELAQRPGEDGVIRRKRRPDALPTLEDTARSELLLDRFMERLPKDLRETVWINNAEKTMDVF